MTARADALAKVQARWAACVSCPLSAGRRNVVVGELYIGAKDVDVDNEPLLLVVGEAPGQAEDAEGRPFCGPSGKLLREEWLQAAGVRLALITNAVACRPPSNRTPTVEECTACQLRLAQAVKAVRPAAVLQVGRTAEQALRGGLPLAGAEVLDGLPRASIVHPSALLRQGWPNSLTEKQVRANLAKVQRLLQRADMVTFDPRADRGRPGPDGDVVDPETCSHVPARVGSWRTADGEQGPEIWACKRCGIFVEG